MAPCAPPQVRSVWEEGPEVEYDRTKAGLETLLRAEVARRKLAAEAAARKARAEKEGAISAPVLKPRAQSAGGRLGLLSFYGHNAERPKKPTRPTERIG